MQLDDLTRQDPESGPRSLQTETGCRFIAFFFWSVSFLYILFFFVNFELSTNCFIFWWGIGGIGTRYTSHNYLPKPKDALGSPSYSCPKNQTITRNDLHIYN